MNNNGWKIADLICGILVGIGTAGAAVTGYHDYKNKANCDNTTTEDKQAQPKTSEGDTTSTSN